MIRKYQSGETVKYSQPQGGAEAAARFVVIEDRGDRVLIRLVCDMRIAPTECLAYEHVERAEPEGR